MTDTNAQPLSGVSAGTWVFDPAHSVMGFAVRHLMSKVRGTFSEFSGEITIDEDQFQSSVSVSVDLSSVGTGNELRDNHMLTNDFFDVEQSPKMTFVSTGVRSAEDGWVLDGDLTLRDVTKAIEIQLQFLGLDSTGIAGEPRIGFEGRTSISRSDFGVSFGLIADGSKIVISDKVEILLEIEATPAE
jgi:polyisoprenoid-binding protein YceI